jgi:hypothetical protein
MLRHGDALVIFFVSFFLFNANFNFTMTTIAPRHHRRKASHDDPTAATTWDGTTDNDNAKNNNNVG